MWAGPGWPLEVAPQSDQRDLVPVADRHPLARPAAPVREVAVYDRHRRWSADGTWGKILRLAHADADATGRSDWSLVSVDSTSRRAHQHAAGA
jgi:transposase